jgi:hypothetical protein
VSPAKRHPLDEPFTHHQYTGSRPSAHVPETKFMRQLELNDLMARLRQFALKDDAATHIAITATSALVDQLEEKYANQMLMQSRESRELNDRSDASRPVVEHAVESDSLTIPANAVDPINRITKRKDTTKSTKYVAKRMKVA